MCCFHFKLKKEENNNSFSCHNTMNSDLTTSDASVGSTNKSDESIILNVDTVIKLVKKFAFFIVIYSVGYFGFSIVWAYGLAIFIILKHKWTKEKRAKTKVARAMALGYEKEIILNSLSQLPSWVKFPEVEKVEWVNRMFKQIWAEINQYTHDLVPKILEPAIQSYVADFKFERIVLGNVPIRVDGVKVYDQESRHKIVMDLDVSYAGDCYVTFQTFKFTGGIRDIQLYGRMRVVLTPLISRLPIIGGVQVYFMAEPRIDFDLIKVTQILDVPLIRNKIKSTTMKVINSMFLFPNVYSVKLDETVNMSKLTIFKAEGILRTHVIEAKNLVNKDFIGKSDPYVILSLGSIRVETPVISNSLNPKWDFWTEFEAESNSELKIELWDRDDGSKDESLGHTRIDILKVAKSGQADLWMKLEGVEQGTIHIRLTWLNMTSNYSDLDAAIKEAELLSSSLHSALLMVYLESSSKLPMVSKVPPSPYIEARVEKIIRTTDVEKRTCEPVWEKGLTFMVKDPKRAILDIRIWDDETKRSLGDLCYKVDNIQDNSLLEIRRQTFLLNSNHPEASIICSMKLRIFKNQSQDDHPDNEIKPLRNALVKQASSASTRSKMSQNSFATSLDESESAYSEDQETSFSLSDSSDQSNSGLGNIKLSISYSVQRQKLVVLVHEVELPITKSSQGLDFYVKLYLQTNKHKNNKRKTKVVKNNRDPIFNETFEFLISSRDLNWTRLTVEVITDKTIRKKFLGKAIIGLDRCDNLTEPFTHLFNLKRKSNTDMYHLN